MSKESLKGSLMEIRLAMSHIENAMSGDEIFSRSNSMARALTMIRNEYDYALKEYGELMFSESDV